MLCLRRWPRMLFLNLNFLSQTGHEYWYDELCLSMWCFKKWVLLKVVMQIVQVWLLLCVNRCFIKFCSDDRCLSHTIHFKLLEFPFILSAISSLLTVPSCPISAGATMSGSITVDMIFEIFGSKTEI